MLYTFSLSLSYFSKSLLIFFLFNKTFTNGERERETKSPAIVMNKLVPARTGAGKYNTKGNFLCMRYVAPSAGYHLYII